MISGRGIVVARWRGGGQEPLGMRGGRTLVELNMFPVSSRLSSDYWTGDAAALLRNALKYSLCMPCTPGTFVCLGAARCCTESVGARGRIRCCRTVTLVLVKGSGGARK